MTPPVVRLQGIERRFGPVVALDGADLELRKGEVHGVLGANGAGKSTLFNVLGGLLRPDAGRLEVDGTAVTLSSPRDAWKHGIGLVHQHFTLVPRLTVLENLALGTRGRSGRPSVVREATIETMERTGLVVPLDEPVERLGVGDRQRVEILKALQRDPRILVLDEPTAVLTPGEAAGLFELLLDLADGGRAVALVAHKVDEVLAVSQRLTVLRDGATVLTCLREETSESHIVRAMVGDEKVDAAALGLGGRGRPEPPGAHATGSGADVAALVGVRVAGPGGPGLDGVDLQVRPGEIVGVAGVDGNGQRELAAVLAGRLQADAGTVTLPQAVGFISQDRSREGLVGDFDLTENIALAFQRKPAFRKGPWLRWERLEEEAEKVRRRHEVQAPSVRTLARSLSGGNQQRVIVGRELEMAGELLVAENPSRGLDVAAAAFVHDELERLAGEGVAVVLISTDLDEVLALSHRVLAIARGRLREVEEGRRTREGVGSLMLGVEVGNGASLNPRGVEHRTGADPVAGDG